MTQGVYIIRNSVNGKFYIGSSIEIESRWKFHVWSLRKGTHANNYLQRAWDKYGESAFIFTILEECTADEVLLREQHFIDTLQPYLRHIGYNISYNAYGGTANTKTVLQYDKGGNFICSYSSLKEAAAAVGVLSAQSISDVVNDRAASCWGFLWRLQDGNTVPQQIATPYVLSSKGNYLPLSKPQIMQFGMDGMFIDTHDTAKDAAASSGCSISSITQCLSGKRPSGGGYIWYYNDGGIIPTRIITNFVYQNGKWVSTLQNKAKLRPIYQYDLDGRYIREWTGVATVVKELGIDRGMLHNALNNPQHVATPSRWSVLRTTTHPACTVQTEVSSK